MGMRNRHTPPVDHLLEWRLVHEGFTRSVHFEAQRTEYTKTSGLFSVTVSWDAQTGDNPRTHVGVRNSEGVYEPLVERKLTQRSTRDECARVAFGFLRAVDPVYGFGGD